MTTDARKMMIYLPLEQSKQINELATELDRPRSWIIQKAIDLSYNTLRNLRTQIPSKAKKTFLKALKETDKQTENQDPNEMETFAAQVVRAYRAQVKKRRR